jgi:hypothetical protein
MIAPPGAQATRSQQLLLAPLIPRRSSEEVIIIHHVTADTPYWLQLEIERRCPTHGVGFDRIVL